VSPVKYELGFYIPEDDILHSHCRENLKSYIGMLVGYWWKSTGERDHQEDQDVGGRIILRWIMVWVSVGTSGELLQMRQ
jgi:hypothetical protein